MTESDYHARIRALQQLLNEEKAKRAGLEQRLVAVEQSLQQKWQGASAP